VDTVACIGAGGHRRRLGAHFPGPGLTDGALGPRAGRAEKLDRLVRPRVPALTELGLADGRTGNNLDRHRSGLADAVSGRRLRPGEARRSSWRLKRRLLADIDAVTPPTW